ncbi:hypothetical protein JY651_36020 [Pyxidicoccus parkwayensis]|uniref:Uncharacterized protein n=1 Tax=Pyxidicoccus parkwayensis TaxID=2813578 RepID=A0ABX7NP32_9BACT|nr:hypothetical protein [Pyxidicoccus parkwaysis]QSQ20607.1 hypothetical protein JY651_36020 [Pyxidicoccus parkwaysis]
METLLRSVHDSALNRQLTLLREVLASQTLDAEAVEALETLARRLVDRSQRLRTLGQMLKGTPPPMMAPVEPVTPAYIKATVERSDEELLQELPALIERLRAKGS